MQRSSKVGSLLGTGTRLQIQYLQILVTQEENNYTNRHYRFTTVLHMYATQVLIFYHKASAGISGAQNMFWSHGWEQFYSVRDILLYTWHTVECRSWFVEYSSYSVQTSVDDPDHFWPDPDPTPQISWVRIRIRILNLLQIFFRTKFFSKNLNLNHIYERKVNIQVCLKG
jgi:hypothetical protein